MNVQPTVAVSGNDGDQAMSKAQDRSKSRRTNISTQVGRREQPKRFSVWTRGALVCAVAVTVFSALVYRVMADGGALDPTFNGSGKVTTSFGADVQAFAVAIQPDTKIV